MHNASELFEHEEGNLAGEEGVGRCVCVCVTGRSSVVLCFSDLKEKKKGSAEKQKPHFFVRSTYNDMLRSNPIMWKLDEWENPSDLGNVEATFEKTVLHHCPDR